MVHDIVAKSYFSSIFCTVRCNVSGIFYLYIPTLLENKRPQCKMHVACALIIHTIFRSWKIKGCMQNFAVVHKILLTIIDGDGIHRLLDGL